MSWDPALLRKYTTTSHLKLLSQVRTELREQPIQRPLVTSRSKAATGFGSRRGGGRSTVETRASAQASSGPSSPDVATVPNPQQHNHTRRRSAAPALVSPAAHEDPHQPIVAVPVLMDPSLHGEH